MLNRISSIPEITQKIGLEISFLIKNFSFFFQSMDLDSIEDVVTQSSVESEINMLSDSSIMYEEVVVDSTGIANTEVNESDLVKLSLVSSASSPTILTENPVTHVLPNMYSFLKNTKTTENSTILPAKDSSFTEVENNSNQNISNAQEHDGTKPIKKVIKITPKLLSSTVSPTSLSVSHPQYRAKHFISKVLLKPPVVTSAIATSAIATSVVSKLVVTSKQPTVSIEPISSNIVVNSSTRNKTIETEKVQLDKIIDKPFTESNKFDPNVGDSHADGETDSIKSEKTDDSTNSKLKREFKQLQKMKNDSKILTEFINDGETRIRKVKKKSKQEELELLNSSIADNDSIASRSSNRDRSRSRSLSRNVSPFDSRGHSPKDEKSFEKSRRNMRSQNAEFTAKHQRFLQGIQNQQESDISDFSDNENDDKLGDRSFTENRKTIHPPPKVGVSLI